MLKYMYLPGAAGRKPPGCAAWQRVKEEEENGMLVILYGLTADFGKQSREHFRKRGYEEITKYYWLPPDFALRERFGSRPLSPKEVVLACDFIYENNGMLVGFNKEQIINAVRGRKNCLLTASAAAIDFMRQIRAAYGEYVTIAGAYIDETVLRRMYEALPEMTPDELERRLETGRDIKRSLLRDRKLFDYFVIYGGESSPFDMSSIAVQYDYILERCARVEMQLNSRMYVELPYTGNEPYIFVSYSHQDISQVFPVLRSLQLSGCRVWYDEGIGGGENWRRIVGSKIQSDKNHCFLLFSSASSAHSNNVIAETNLALLVGKKIITVRLDDARFYPDLEKDLSQLQYLSSSDPRFPEKLLASVGDSVRAAAPTAHDASAADRAPASGDDR